MAKKKKPSFVLYADWLEDLEELDMEERGQLLTALLTSANDEEPEEMDRPVRMVFKIWNRQIERDRTKYEATCAARAAAGAAGGRASGASRSKNKQSEASEANESNAKQNEHEHGTEHEHEHDPENNILTLSRYRRREEPMPANADDVCRYLFDHRGEMEERIDNLGNESVSFYTALSEASGFAEYYAARNWRVNGEPVHDWPALFITWLRRFSQYRGREVMER